MEVDAGGSRQIAEVRSGSSFQAQYDLRLHFGLGFHDGPVEASIYWPDGEVQSLTILELDRYLTITQEWSIRDEDGRGRAVAATGVPFDGPACRRERSSLGNPVDKLDAA